MNFIFVRLARIRFFGSGTQALPPKSDLPLLQQHRSKNNRAFQNELDITVNVFEQQNVGKKSKDQHADERSGHRPFPTHQISAANDDRSNRVELSSRTRVRLPLP